MKNRIGYVSNSSGSSFILVGFRYRNGNVDGHVEDKYKPMGFTVRYLTDNEYIVGIEPNQPPSYYGDYNIVVSKKEMDRIEKILRSKLKTKKEIEIVSVIRRG